MCPFFWGLFRQVSSDHYGLKEANMCEDLRVKVQLVQDMRIRSLHRGQNIDAYDCAPSF